MRPRAAPRRASRWGGARSWADRARTCRGCVRRGSGLVCQHTQKQAVQQAGVDPTLAPSPSPNPLGPQEFQAAAAEVAAGLAPASLLEESEARCALLEERAEALEAERDALQDRVGTPGRAAGP